MVPFSYCPCQRSYENPPARRRSEGRVNSSGRRLFDGDGGWESVFMNQLAVVCEVPSVGHPQPAVFRQLHKVLCSRDPVSRSREEGILKDLIVAAKRDFAGAGADDSFITVDTPVPYRITGLSQRISEAMGRLDKPDSSLPYLRLLTTIENLRKDRRYAFMFSGLTLRDNMAEILSRILRIPVAGKPITIFDISAVPSEIVEVVVSLLCRLVFDFALWSEREEAIPILLVCDEAHRYIHADETLGFDSARREDGLRADHPLDRPHRQGRAQIRRLRVPGDAAPRGTFGIHPLAMQHRVRAAHEQRP